ncbi:18761_t:CDS:2, partial [Racocetra fulgida]
KWYPNYIHSIEESDMQKRLKFIKVMVGNKAIKDYNPLMIANIIRKEVSKLCEDSGIEYLKIKKVTNIKQKLVGLINSHLVRDADLKSDILITIEFLVKNNYQTESFQKQESLEWIIQKKFAPQWSSWYMLFDQSNVESNGVALTFLGLYA